MKFLKPTVLLFFCIISYLLGLSNCFCSTIATANDNEKEELKRINYTNSAIHSIPILITPLAVIPLHKIMSNVIFKKMPKKIIKNYLECLAKGKNYNLKYGNSLKNYLLNHVWIWPALYYFIFITIPNIVNQFTRFNKFKNAPILNTNCLRSYNSNPSEKETIHLAIDGTRNIYYDSGCFSLIESSSLFIFFLIKIVSLGIIEINNFEIKRILLSPTNGNSGADKNTLNIKNCESITKEEKFMSLKLFGAILVRLLTMGLFDITPDYYNTCVSNNTLYWQKTLSSSQRKIAAIKGYNHLLEEIENNKNENLIIDIEGVSYGGEIGINIAYKIYKYLKKNKNNNSKIHVTLYATPLSFASEWKLKKLAQSKNNKIIFMHTKNDFIQCLDIRPTRVCDQINIKTPFNNVYYCMTFNNRYCPIEHSEFSPSFNKKKFKEFKEHLFSQKNKNQYYNVIFD
jgi:hypothetical protein